MNRDDTALLTDVISRVSRENQINYSTLNAKSGRGDAPLKRHALNGALFVLLMLANLFVRAKPRAGRGGKIQLLWSSHAVSEFASAQTLLWRYSSLRLPVVLKVWQFRDAIVLARRARADNSGPARDTLMIALEVLVWHEVLARYAPSHIIHNGTICRRSYIISEMAQPGTRIYALQHGFLSYPAEVKAPKITGFIRDAKFPEQDYSAFLNTGDGLRLRCCDFSESRWKMAPADDTTLALALNPNVTLGNLRLIYSAVRSGKRFSRIYLYLHPRQSRLFYAVISLLFAKCEVNAHRHLNLDTLVTFPSSIIMEFEAKCAHIYMVTYLSKSKANAGFESVARTLETRQELEKVLAC